MDGASHEMIKLVVKHTFLELELHDNNPPKMQRCQSEPVLACVEPPLPTTVPCKSVASSTPTTCLSLNGDDEIGSPSLSPFESENEDDMPSKWSFNSAHIVSRSSQAGVAWPQAWDTKSRPTLHSKFGQPVARSCHVAAVDPSTMLPLCGSDAAMLRPWSESSSYDSTGCNTTVMFRNLCKHLTQADLVAKLCEVGYRGLFDFVYMPMNLRESGNFGYTFVNFVNHAAAARAMSRTDFYGAASDWICTWSDCQGLNANVERYRNSPLMHHSVPEECKPGMYNDHGTRVPFPASTKYISKPRIHWSGPKKIGEVGDVRTTASLHADASTKQQPRRGKKLRR